MQMTFDTKSASFPLMAFREERLKLASRLGCNRRRHLKCQHRLVEQWPLLALAAKVRFDGPHRSDEAFRSKVALGRECRDQVWPPANMLHFSLRSYELK